MLNFKFFFTLVILLNFLTVNAQTFQWGKRGGATDALDLVTSNLRQEEVYDIVTDSQRNIYILSAVGKNGLDVDGVTKTNFGANSQITDIMLASFACDGTYRWSKVIGGKHYDNVNDISIDQQDNIYIAGRFGSCNDTAYPPRIDNDVIISQSPPDCSVNFLAKYNSSGVLQWIKRPQTAVTSVNAFSIGMDIDTAGNSYWLLQLPSGSYADGAFVNTMTGQNFFILKYDTNGNYLSATYIDLQLSNGGFLAASKFYRNPYNGNFYITSSRGSSGETASAGGQTVTASTFITSYSSTATFLWIRQNTNSTTGAIRLDRIVFDPDGSIYFSGSIIGLSLDSFIGLSVAEGIRTNFVMKTDATVQTKLWSTYHPQNGAYDGAIALNNNEIAFAGYCYNATFTWGSQTINVNGANQGTEALLARFDKNSGSCLGLTRILGETGYNDGGTALVVDNNGDYIYGGFAGRGMTFTTNTLLATGIQSDFFVAKYSSAVCSLGTDQFSEEELQIYPNPVKTSASISTKEELNYVLYTLTGVELSNGKVNQYNNTIDLSAYPTGIYLLQTTATTNGNVKTVKVIKE